jgi:polyphenol oxidase
MYLYFHERILGELVGDKTLTLPFWDWDTPGRDRLPPIYGDPGTQDDPNPLFDQTRGASGNNEIPPGIVDAPSIQMMLSPTSFEQPGGFGGTPDGSDSSAGTLENSPHGPVHIWTGDPSLQAVRPDMGVLASAARDPVFFAHHANIDRIWDVWLNLQNGRSNPQESAWAMETFNFYSQSATPEWVAMAISDTVDHETSLRYLYRGTPNPAATRGLAPIAVVTSQQNGGTIDISPQSRETIKVPVPVEPEAEATRGISRRKRVHVLHIHGIELPADEQAFLRVFVNQPDANAQTAVSSPSFVGQFAILAMSKPSKMQAHQKAAHRHLHNKDFILTEQQVSLFKGKKDLDVKLVAVGGKLTKIPYKRAYISIREH